MEPFASHQGPIRSALFVDFDNIYIGLSKSDPQAAERFASDPARWLSWLERGMPGRDGGKESPLRERSILVRRCYPNPDAGFRRFRSFFTSAAFAVTDCPTLTRTGKNSSDIYMVMDILDLLNHKTYFDEFIIFSGDSDFMPVLLRLRAHDRRTTTLAIDFMPPAYKAACDLVISEEEFIEEALGVSHENGCGGQGRGRVSMNTVKEMAMRVYESACTSGEVAGADLPDILKDFREFRDSNNWLGYGTSQRLAEALACSEPRLTLVRLNATMYKLVVKPLIVKSDGRKDRIPDKTPVVPEKPQAVPEKQQVAFDKPQAMPERNQAAPEKPQTVVEIRPAADKRTHANKPGAGRGEKDEKPSKLDPARLREKVITIVREIVAGSRTPVLLARVSQQVVNRLGQQVLESQWAGAGSFKRLLQNTPDLGLEISTQPEPGYIFDPQRHSHPQSARDLRPTIPVEGSEESQPLNNGEEKSDDGGKRTGGRLKPIRRADPVLFSAVDPEPEMVENFVEAPLLEEQASEQPAREARAVQETTGQESVSGMEVGQVSESFLESEMQEDYNADEEESEENDSYRDQAPPTSIDELAQRISRVTGVPDLTSEEYALVFTGIVNELQQIANGDKTYSTYQSSKAVSDWCAVHGVPISRSDIVLIFKGIIFQDGGRFGKQPGSYTERDLANVVCANVRALCKRARLELSEYEDHLLEEWITSGLDDMPDLRGTGLAVDDAGHENGAQPAEETIPAEAPEPPAPEPDQPSVEDAPAEQD